MKMVAAISLIAAVAAADELVWPSDFWQSVNSRIEAVTPVSAQIGTDTLSGAFDSRAEVSLVAGLPSMSQAFDSRPYVEMVSATGINMVSYPPGLRIIVR